MAELTAAPGDGAVLEKLPSQQSIASNQHSPATAFGEESGAKRDRRIKRMVPGQAGQRPKQRQNDTAEAKRQPSAYAKAAENYRDKALELMLANVNATLEYAQQLATVRSPADFIELTTNHTRKRLGLIMTHTAAIGALSQSLTTRNAEMMTASIARVFNR